MNVENKYALIVIDMQNGFIDGTSAQCVKGAKETVPIIADVIQNCRDRSIPVFFVTRLYRENGSNVEYTRYNSWIFGGKAMSPNCDDRISTKMPTEFNECENDYHLIKPRYSAFFHTELDLILRRLGINTIILTGTTTPNCIRATCYDGISLDYNVIVIEDCTSSNTKEIQEANIFDMSNVGARIISSIEFISGIEFEDVVSDIRQEVLKNLK